MGEGWFCKAEERENGTIQLNIVFVSPELPSSYRTHRLSREITMERDVWGGGGIKALAWGGSLSRQTLTHIQYCNFLLVHEFERWLRPSGGIPIAKAQYCYFVAATLDSLKIKVRFANIMIAGYENEQRACIAPVLLSTLVFVSYHFFSSIDEMKFLCWQYVALREYSRVCVFVMCQSRYDNYQQLFNTHYMLQMQIFRIFPSSNTWHVSYKFVNEHPNLPSPHRINVGEKKRKKKNVQPGNQWKQCSRDYKTSHIVVMILLLACAEWHWLSLYVPSLSPMTSYNKRKYFLRWVVQTFPVRK